MLARGAPLARTNEKSARNEALFREVNERVAEVSEHLEADGALEFLCECADAGCHETVAMSAAEYESIRADGRQFLICRGHDASELEHVVAESSGYAVVRKQGNSALIAERMNPRDRR